ncbi:hypothetical protein, partial [Priestia megaterium]|uniref:hypothetical protein n=1 Tax=Priestia megaterium TaxID=1404 RepID=UPI00301BDA14
SAPFLHSIHDVVLKRLSVIIGEFGIAVIEYFTVADYISFQKTRKKRTLMGVRVLQESLL